jgi:hypothetical protein
VDVEHDKTVAMFSGLDEIEAVADTLAADDSRRIRLFNVVARVLDEADPVRPVIAARLLDLNEKTVRAWANEGVLRISIAKPRLLLDVHRVHDVRILVRDLKAAGRTKGLLDEVYRQLADSALLAREDLQGSLAEMQRGDGRLVRGRA